MSFRLFNHIFRSPGRATGRVMALAVTLASSGPLCRADEPAIGLIHKGQGPALVFIPGLNSGSDTFAGTCEAFVATHRCLLLHLPGFAGRTPMNLERGFLAPIKDAVIALLRDQNLSEVTLIGHSLGGELSLMLALDAPELVAKIVVLDSLPFYSAIQNPAMTVELARPMAEQVRAQMNAQSEEDYLKNAAASVKGMTNTDERVALLTQWSRSSDRATTTTAMVDLMTTDLRERIAAIEEPVLVLGSWAAYRPYGSTLESTKVVFAAQFARLETADIRMSATGFHFLTWDDGDWVNEQIRQFIAQ